MTATLRIGDGEFVSNGQAAYLELRTFPNEPDKIILRVIEKWPGDENVRIHWIVSAGDLMAMGGFAQAHLDAGKRP